jgi:hypothetical protein
VRSAGELAHELAHELPAAWRVLEAPEEGGSRILVAHDPSPAWVAAQLWADPSRVIVAVVGEHADPERIQDLFGAGAEACVRGSNPRLIAAHVLAACRRHRI